MLGDHGHRRQPIGVLPVTQRARLHTCIHIPFPEVSTQRLGSRWPHRRAHYSPVLAVRQLDGSTSNDCNIGMVGCRRGCRLNGSEHTKHEHTLHHRISRISGLCSSLVCEPHVSCPDCDYDCSPNCYMSALSDPGQRLCYALPCMPAALFYHHHCGTSAFARLSETAPCACLTLAVASSAAAPPGSYTRAYVFQADKQMLQRRANTCVLALRHVADVARSLPRGVGEWSVELIEVGQCNCLIIHVSAPLLHLVVTTRALICQANHLPLRQAALQCTRCHQEIASVARRHLC